MLTLRFYETFRSFVSFLSRSKVFRRNDVNLIWFGGSLVQVESIDLSVATTIFMFTKRDRPTPPWLCGNLWKSMVNDLLKHERFYHFFVARERWTQEKQYWNVVGFVKQSHSAHTKHLVLHALLIVFKRYCTNVQNDTNTPSITHAWNSNSIKRHL